MWLIVAFLALPLVEIALFILVGGMIGLWPTLGLVVAAVIVGTVVVRAQGARALQRTRQAFDRQGDPSGPLLDGALVVLAGGLLIAPGFLTDAMALALLLPTVRRTMLQWVGARVAARGGARSRGATVIDGTWEEVPPSGQAPGPTQGTSGWTRH
jgi:UPF0716 protein FxsA